MISEKQLFDKLITYSNQQWQISDDINPYELILDMIEHIGDVNPTLRDDLIYTGFYYIIYKYNRLSTEQLKHLVDICLSDKCLFNGLGEISDKVYTRTFTSLLLDIIVQMNNENSFLNEQELLHIYSEVMKYYKLENDYRGYDSVKGWGHSTAHTADTLCDLAKSEHLNKNELMEILNVIREKATINNLGYLYNEDERLINIIESIYERHILSDDEIVDWILSFDNYKRENIFPDRIIENTNRRNFLRSLYFRFLNKNYLESFLAATKKVLDDMHKFY
ncbi:DUF2785 domain-containing protein [Sedimentibacter sp. zth1]|uniref:DUF2785 domain-containing protein n=1 Tax=Sedimentibacter sp. zth1 TaxID=2816908 RepID=UPI001A912EE5|nr:DUF2785 domain-containing protein [Sedimentibacter sp. zth1]QSX06527.1 DUF2785 domain-containing protein [Sedimentibacter sp. zth1]